VVDERRRDAGAGFVHGLDGAVVGGGTGLAPGGGAMGMGGRTTEILDCVQNDASKESRGASDTERMLLRIDAERRTL